MLVTLFEDVLGFCFNPNGHDSVYTNLIYNLKLFRFFTVFTGRLGVIWNVIERHKERTYRKFRSLILESFGSYYIYWNVVSI